MPIVPADIDLHLTVTTGPGLSTAQGDSDLSLGEFASSTLLVDNTLHNLFDVITGDDNSGLDVEYRAIWIANDHGSLTLENPKVWMSSEVAGGANIAIGLDPAGVSSSTNASAQGAEVGDEDTAPAGVTFTSPTTKAGGLAPANVPNGSGFMLWVRRTATDSAALNNDGVQLTVEGDTAA